jgi:hypothetical protein
MLAWHDRKGLFPEAEGGQAMLSELVDAIRDVVTDDAATALTAGQRPAAGAGVAVRPGCSPAPGAAGNLDPGAAPRRVSADGYAVIGAGGWLDLARLARLFGDVPADLYDTGYGSAGTGDPYVPEGFRCKSLGRLRLHGTGPAADPHELSQSREASPVHGGIARHCQLLPAEFAAGLADALRLFQTVTRLAHDEEVLVQAQRVTAGTGRAGHPVVEGFHQDGVDYAGILLVSRHGLAGGKTLLAADSGGSALVFAGELEPGQLLVLDDRRLWHYTSPVRDVTGPGLGHRDVILFGWPSCCRPRSWQPG